MRLDLDFFTSLPTSWARLLNQITRTYTVSFRRDRRFTERENRREQRRILELRQKEDTEKAAMLRKDKLKQVQVGRAQAEAKLARAAFEAKLRMDIEREQQTRPTP